MYGSFGWMDEHLFFFILFYFLPTSCNFPSVTIFSFESSTLPPLTHLWQSWLQIKHQGAVVTRTKPISTSLGRAIFREGPWHTLGQLPKSLDFIDLFLWWQHLFFFFFLLVADRIIYSPTAILPTSFPMKWVSLKSLMGENKQTV